MDSSEFTDESPSSGSELGADKHFESLVWAVDSLLVVASLFP